MLTDIAGSLEPAVPADGPVVKTSLAGRVAGDMLVFVVKDNGCGFDACRMDDKNPSEKGIGLLALKERCAMLGGTVEFQSSPGNGTRVTVRVPVKQGKKS